MLSQTAEYALRAVVCLGEHYGEPRTTRQIAEATHVPSGYLSKVLQLLSRAGIVRAQRGLHGGYGLTRSPGELTVLDVLQAIDPIQRIHSCPLGLDHGSKKLCSLHQRLDTMAASIEREFGDLLIADVLADRATGPPLCKRKVHSLLEGNNGSSRGRKSADSDEESQA